MNRLDQSMFTLNVAKLILFAFNNKIELTFGEAWRTDEQQAIYVENKQTKVAHSKHQDRLAIDLNVFVGGVYKTDKESYKPLAEYWTSLHPSNRAGYFWGWDANHFEMNV